MPKRCLGCGTLVEHVGGGPDGRWGVDRRVPTNEILVCPPLCWSCRGAVLLDKPPPDHDFRPMDGALGAMGGMCARNRSPVGVPVMRVITGPPRA